MQVRKIKKISDDRRVIDLDDPPAIIVNTPGPEVEDDFDRSTESLDNWDECDDKDWKIE